ncbi:MAG: hypothetical protein ACI8ZB_002654 [Desulforhopalus sp.]|jgi:hypothetical protein
MSNNHIKSSFSDAEREALETLFPTPTEEIKDKSLETSEVSPQWTEEDDRFNSSIPFLISEDTEWIDTLYKAIYPLPVSKGHKYTFHNIITNLSLRKTEIYLQLHKSSYKETHLPEDFVRTQVSKICDALEIRGYIKIKRGYKFAGSKGVASTVQPTEKLLSIMPDDMSYEIMEEGLVIPKDFSYETFPQSAIETRALLSEYNKTVEPENMLYASHKGGFEINGRFTGSSVCIMKKEDRKNILIDGEPTVELDISNCLPFLLYASELEDELQGDAYEIKGIPRKLAKKAFMIAINNPTRAKALSAIDRRIRFDYPDLSYNASYILDQTEINHSELVEEHLYKGLGLKLMYLEAQCMAKFMRSMLDKGIKFYPIYDSVRVPVSQRDIVEVELKKAFTIGGIEPVIHED